MKRFEAIISPTDLEPLLDRLRLIGIPGMTVHQLYGVTREGQERDGQAQPGQALIYRGASARTDLYPRVRLDIVLPDDWVEGVISATLLVVGKGPNPGGRILITPVDEVIRIRTAETGRDAISSFK